MPDEITYSGTTVTYGEKSKGKKLFKKVDSFLKKKGEQYKDWKARAPERQQARLKKLEGKLDLQRTREKIYESKARVQRSRLELMQRRQRSMQGAPSLFGGSSFGAPPTDPFGKPPKSKKKKSSKKKGKKRK